MADLMVDIDSGSDLPEDGTVVRAMRYESMEYDRAPYEVTGRLLTRPSPFGPPPQCWVDGVQVESKTITADGLAATTFDGQPQKVFSYFPPSRYRGRTLRKRLQTTDRVGIGGFSLFYKVERRRI